jgi:hypothetical protein
MRNKGTFGFSANFEPKLKSPLDARQIVDSIDDLINPAIWEDSQGNVWLYNGFIVSIATGGLYQLLDANNYTNSASWQKLGSSSGGTTGGTSGSTGITYTFVPSGATIITESGNSVNIFTPVVDVSNFITGGTNGLKTNSNTIGLGGILTGGTAINIDSGNLYITGTTLSRNWGLQLAKGDIGIGDYFNGTTGKAYIQVLSNSSVKGIEMNAQTEDNTELSTLSVHSEVIQFASYDTRYGQYHTATFSTASGQILFGVGDGLGGDMAVQLSVGLGLRYMGDYTAAMNGNGTTLVTSDWVMSQIYTGATNFYTLQSEFLSLTGTTLPANYVSKLHFNSFTGSTATALAGKLGTGYTPTWASISGKPALFDGNYNSLSNKPTLFNGSYSGLTGKPDLTVYATKTTISTYTGTTAPNTFAAKIHTHAYSGLTGLPTLFNGVYSSLTGKPTIPTDLSNLTDNTSLLFDRSYNSLNNKPTLFTGNTFVQSGATRISKVGNVVTIYSPSGITTFAGLSDVTITAPVANHTIKYTGTKWINEAPADMFANVLDGQFLKRSGTTIVGGSAGGGNYLPLSGGTLTGILSMTDGSGVNQSNLLGSTQYFFINGRTGSTRGIFFRTLNKYRWGVLTDSNAESVNDTTHAGSDFRISAYSGSSGSVMYTPISISRATGLVSFSNGINISGTTITTSPTELNYVKGVTSAIQTQLSAKAAQSAINTYTGTTAINTFANKTAFNTYSGATNTAIGNKLTTTIYQTYTGTTAPAAFAPFTPTIKLVTGTSYTALSADNGKIIEFNSGSATAITLPTGLTTGWNASVVNYGAGVKTLTAGAGVTIRSKNSYVKLSTIYDAATVYYRGSGIWVAFGDLTST